MNTDYQDIKYKKLTEKIIKIFYNVYNALGYGFLEKVYENSLMVVLSRDKIPAIQQAPISVHFEGEIVGNYVADILVDDKIILELKCVETLANVHRAQVLNYLKATGKQLAIILNFAKEKLEYERLAF